MKKFVYFTEDYVLFLVLSLFVFFFGLFVLIECVDWQKNIILIRFVIHHVRLFWAKNKAVVVIFLTEIKQWMSTNMAFFATPQNLLVKDSTRLCRLGLKIFRGIILQVQKWYCFHHLSLSWIYWSNLWRHVWFIQKNRLLSHIRKLMNFVHFGEKYGYRAAWISFKN